MGQGKAARAILAAVGLFVAVSEAFVAFPGSRYGIQALFKQVQLGVTTEKQTPPNLDAARPADDFGLKIRAGQWRWPPVWPYTPDYFVVEDASSSAFKTGQPVLFDEDASAGLEKFLEQQVFDGCDVLDLGAGSSSYLPSNVEYGRVCGIGFNTDDLGKNSLLTESRVQDFNENQILPYETDSFDVIVSFNMVSFLTSPRVIFGEMFRVLKPGGVAVVGFTEKGVVSDSLKKGQVKVWKDMNNEQHMWIVGSYFHFSAGSGWGDLRGYDLANAIEIGKSQQKKSRLAAVTDLFALKDAPKGTPVYLVSAVKNKKLDMSNPAQYMLSSFWSVSSMDEPEKELVSLRLTADYNRAQTEEDKETAIQSPERVAEMYEVLKQVPQHVLPLPFKAMLAAVIAPKWKNSDEQINALKQGLGLAPPDEMIWKPLGEMTSAMNPKDKVILLADLIPYFDNNNSKYMSKLASIVTVLRGLISLIKARCPDMESGDVQLLGCDIIATDFLPCDDVDKFGRWVQTLSAEELQGMLEKRKRYEEDAKAALQVEAI